MTRIAMDKVLKSALIGLVLLGGSSVLVGCDEGPLEEAGEEIDDAADELDQ